MQTIFLPEPCRSGPFAHDKNDHLAFELPSLQVDDSDPLLSAAVPEFGVHICQLFAGNSFACVVLTLLEQFVDKGLRFLEAALERVDMGIHKVRSVARTVSSKMVTIGVSVLTSTTDIVSTVRDGMERCGAIFLLADRYTSP